MANRRFNQFRYSMESQIVDLFAKVTIGAAGAPTLSKAKGIKSITRTGTGAYTVALQDNYQRLVMGKHVIVNATAPAAPAMFVVADNSASATAPGINIQMNAAGAATDPGNGEVLLLQISLSNSSV